MKYPSLPLAQATVALCEYVGLKNIVISPGSRNAPLTIGFTENPYFKTYSVVDERCAAFFALGMAQQTQKPVALLCTSGSALLNYYPAIAEAFYSRIPLVILSADRPANFIDIGDGQTIRQPNVYQNHILYSANCIEEDTKMTYNQEVIYTALQTAQQEMGPVHINLPFSEPLYNKTREVLGSIKEENLPKLTKEVSNSIVNQTHQDEWLFAKKKLVLVGVLSPNSVEQKWLDILMKDPSVLVLTESTSNLKGARIIPSIDMLLEGLTDSQHKKLQPDLLLTFGGLVVSKKIKSFLRSYKPTLHWHVDPYRPLDTYFVLDTYFKISIQGFLENVLESEPKTSSFYQEMFWNEYQQRINKRSVFSKEVPFSDFGVYSRIFQQLPENIDLQLSNSATIRYGQLFSMPESTSVFCNRGTSGIDGSTSTAIGAAVASKKQTLLITGDLSFFYDSNALWNSSTPKNFRIIIINNSGGGIFRIIPGPKQAEKFTEYFETKHELSAEHLANMYDYKYIAVEDYDSLEEALSGFYDTSDTPKIMEVFTPRESNETILQEYFKFLQE